MPLTLSIRPNVGIRVLLRVLIPCGTSIAPRTLTLSQKLHTTTSLQPHIPYRAFSYTPILYKKKTKADRGAAGEASSRTMVDDPFDTTILESSISKIQEKLKNDLSKLRTGGRFNPELLENLRVSLSKESKKTERLGDLAQVLPKGGRTLNILVGEKDHLQAITTAIQASKDLNLQPQPDALNPSQLVVPIPPPTKESRDTALAAASRTGETAKIGVHGARAVQQKRLRGMELKKSVRPDDLKKAHKVMEAIVEKAMGEVKKSVEAARKGMEQA